MGKILVIGASGFLGRRLALGLLAEGHEVRCVARQAARVQDLAGAGCEIVQGDISDPASMQRAMESIQAVYVSIHTLSPQKGDGGFMDVETEGMQNVVAACKANGVRRLIYVTFLGMTPDSPSAWATGRWAIEQSLLNSGLDVTVIRPGQIVGVGGHGFDAMVGQAGKRIVFRLGSGRQKMRNIAVDDLVYYLIGVLDDARAHGKCFDVGCDDLLTTDQMIDVASDVLGRPHPVKLGIPTALAGALAPMVERRAKLPRGALRSYLNGMGRDLDGDPMPIREILPRPPLSYRRAVERALA